MPGLSRNLRQLDEALAQIGEQTMTLSEFDGFVAGLLVCPEVILPSAWLSRVWSGDRDAEDDDETVFDDTAHVQRVTGLILEHYNSVADCLARRPHRYNPILDVHEPTDEVFWEFWIGGFTIALALRPAAWAPLFDEPGEASEALTTLLMLEAVSRKEADLPKGLPSAAELQGDAPEIIATCIAKLAAHRTNPFVSSPAAARSKTGRNDPCPCGSGRKYKKCCGAN